MGLTEEQYEIACLIAVEAGTLELCRRCGEIKEGFAATSEAVVSALRLYASGSFHRDFKSVDELESAVHTVIRDYPSDECHCIRRATSD